MHMRIVKAVKPYLIKNGEPTGVVRKLCETPKGQALVKAMWVYYASVMDQNFKCQNVERAATRVIQPMPRPAMVLVCRPRLA